MAAANMIKMEYRSRRIAFSKGDRVSVARQYFDTSAFKYSDELPEEIDRIHGTVKFVFSNSKSMYVHWDIDSTSTLVKFVDAQKEENSPWQTLPELPCLEDDDDEEEDDDDDEDDDDVDEEIDESDGDGEEIDENDKSTAGDSEDADIDISVSTVKKGPKKASAKQVKIAKTLFKCKGKEPEINDDENVLDYGEESEEDDDPESSKKKKRKTKTGRENLEPERLECGPT